MRIDRHSDTGRKNGRFNGWLLQAPLPRLFALCMLLLSFAVVCWGLHDKLSLYAPPHADQPVAKAKLLTDQERTPQVSAAAPRPPLPLAPVLLLLFAAVVRTLLDLRPQWKLREPRMVRRKTPPLPEALHRRPPPVRFRACLGAAPALLPVLA